MEHATLPVLTVSSEEVPPVLADWLQGSATSAMLVSIERLPDGRLVLQAVPDLDPALVARMRKVLSEYADVLRRLT